MLLITIIGLICGGISIIFIVMEIDESFKNWGYLTQNFKAYHIYKLPYIIIKAWLPLIMDVGITLGVVWLFSMGGVMGMLVSLMASSIISSYLYFRRRSSNRARGIR